MLKLIGGITWQTKLLAFLSACAICFALGWRVHGWKINAAQARSIPKAIKTAQKAQKIQAPIVEKKQAEIVRVEKVYITIREKINEKNDQRICFADTAAWSLYNSAITGSDTHRAESPGETRGTAAAKGEGSDTAAGSEIVATVTDVLTNAAINYETCRKNSIKHNALIDTVEAIKDKMCVCGE